MNYMKLLFACLLLGMTIPGADRPISAPVGGGAQREAAPPADLEGTWTGVVFGVQGELPEDYNTPADPRTDHNLISQIIITADWQEGYVRLASVRTDMMAADTHLAAGYGTFGAIYSAQGPEGCMEALNRNLDVGAEDYFVVPWKAAADAVNVLGGIDVDVTDDEMYWFNAYVTEAVKATGIGSSMQKHAGLLHLDGVQAVAYMNLVVSPQGITDTPEEMAARRHTVSEQVLKKAASSKFSDLKNLLTVVEPQIATSFTTQDFINVLSGCRSIKSVESTCVPLKYKQGEDGIFPDTLEENAVYLNGFLYNNKNYACPDSVGELSRELENAGVS